MNYQDALIMVELSVQYGVYEMVNNEISYQDAKKTWQSKKKERLAQDLTTDKVTRELFIKNLGKAGIRYIPLPPGSNPIPFS